MPTTVRITKEEIIAAAYEITKEQGIEAATARAVAKRLKCSIQPVYYVFETMTNMREAVLEKAKLEYTQSLFSNLPDTLKINAVAFNYIRFAREYPYLFKLMFANDKYENISVLDKNIRNENKPRIIRIIKEDYGIGDEKHAEDLHIKGGIFCHGLAMMAISGSINVDDETIGRLIKEVFAGIQKG